MTLDSYDDLSRKGIRYSKMHLRRLEKAKKFPKRVRLSATRVGWVSDEINKWLEMHVAERQTATAA